MGRRGRGYGGPGGRPGLWDGMMFLAVSSLAVFGNGLVLCSDVYHRAGWRRCDGDDTSCCAVLVDKSTVARRDRQRGSLVGEKPESWPAPRSCLASLAG